MKELTSDQTTEVQNWLEKFETIRSKKKINKDFSDAVLLAGILKKLYPKYVELHNYPPRNSTALKFDNWETLNRKVLKKIGLQQSNESLENLCRAAPGAVEYLLYEIMVTSKRNLQKPRPPSDDEHESDNTNVMTVTVNKKIGDSLVEVPQKMILYSLYEKAQNTIVEKDQTIGLLRKKITHLENLLKLKSQRIEVLCYQLAKFSRKKIFFETENHVASNSNPCLLY